MEKLHSEKTVAKIQSTFLQLLEEKEYKKISVKEITMRVGINRTTFYLFYTSKEELAMDICNCFLNEHIEEMFFFLNQSSIERKKILCEIFRKLKKKKNIVLGLWKINFENSSAKDIMQNSIENCIMKFLETSHRTLKYNMTENYYAKLFAVSTITTLEWWMEYCEEYSEEIPADMIKICFMEGTDNLLM